MRPDNLSFLFKSISTLAGIGPKLEILFNKLIGDKIVHLLWHLPYSIIKRKMHDNINENKRYYRSYSHRINNDPLKKKDQDANDIIGTYRNESIKIQQKLEQKFVY